MRWLNRRDHAVVEVPHALTLVLVLLNVAAYALSFRQSGTAVIAGDILLRDGAMYSHALERGEYWRLIGIKLIGLSLSMRKGLALVVALLAITNATLVVFWPVVFPATAAQVMRNGDRTLHEIEPRACTSPATPLAVAGLVLIATLLACRANFIRGLADVGFVGNALRGERARRNGL